VTISADRAVGVARWATPRTDRPTAGHEAARIAELLGHAFLPWQQQVMDVALEYELDGDYPGGRRFAYREIDYGTPRQSGKSFWSLVKVIHRSLMMGESQATVYTMQTGSDAARRLVDEWVPAIEESPLAPALMQVRRSMGSELVRLRTRSTIEILRSGKSAGHGRTLDEAHVDEAMHDSDDRREQATVPAMITRANAQLIVTSTAGTDESIYWRRKVAEGRRLVEDGVTEDIAYFEWSVPDDADVYDDNVLREFHPALGRTQQLGAIRHAARTMSEHEYRRAICNQWTRSDDKVIDWGAWVECRDSTAEIGNDLVLAVDMNKERSGASIAAASWHPDGSVNVELIERHDGISWIVPRMVELRDRHNPTKIVLDGGGPIGALLPEMSRAGLDLDPLKSGDLPKACGAFYDRVMARTLHVRPSDQLDDAVSGAAKWVRGDGFIWRRQTTTSDISPLMCATLAVWGIAGEANHGAVWIY
jgi:hypothetical protein